MAYISISNRCQKQMIDSDSNRGIKRIFCKSLRELSTIQKTRNRSDKSKDTVTNNILDSSNVLNTKTRKGTKNFKMKEEDKINLTFNKDAVKNDENKNKIGVRQNSLNLDTDNDNTLKCEPLLATAFGMNEVTSDELGFIHTKEDASLDENSNLKNPVKDYNKREEKIQQRSEPENRIERCLSDRKRFTVKVKSPAIQRNSREKSFLNQNQLAVSKKKRNLDITITRKDISQTCGKLRRPKHLQQREECPPSVPFSEETNLYCLGAEKDKQNKNDMPVDGNQTNTNLMTKCVSGSENINEAGALFCDEKEESKGLSVDDVLLPENKQDSSRHQEAATFLYPSLNLEKEFMNPEEDWSAELIETGLEPGPMLQPSVVTNNAEPKHCKNGLTVSGISNSENRWKINQFTKSTRMLENSDKEKCHRFDNNKKEDWNSKTESSFEEIGLKRSFDNKDPHSLQLQSYDTSVICEEGKEERLLENIECKQRYLWQRRVEILKSLSPSPTSEKEKGDYNLNACNVDNCNTSNICENSSYKIKSETTTLNEKKNKYECITAYQSSSIDDLSSQNVETKNQSNKHFLFRKHDYSLPKEQKKDEGYHGKIKQIVRSNLDDHQSIDNTRDYICKSMYDEIIEERMRSFDDEVVKSRVSDTSILRNKELSESPINQYLRLVQRCKKRGMKGSHSSFLEKYGRKGLKADIMEPNAFDNRPDLSEDLIPVIRMMEKDLESSQTSSEDHTCDIIQTDLCLFDYDCESNQHNLHVQDLRTGFVKERSLSEHQNREQKNNSNGLDGYSTDSLSSYVQVYCTQSADSQNSLSGISDASMSDDDDEVNGIEDSDTGAVKQNLKSHLLAFHEYNGESRLDIGSSGSEQSTYCERKLPKRNQISLTSKIEVQRGGGHQEHEIDKMSKINEKGRTNCVEYQSSVLYPEFSEVSTACKCPSENVKYWIWKSCDCQKLILHNILSESEYRNIVLLPCDKMRSSELHGDCQKFEESHEIKKSPPGYSHDTKRLPCHLQEAVQKNQHNSGILPHFQYEKKFQPNDVQPCHFKRSHENIQKKHIPVLEPCMVQSSKKSIQSEASFMPTSCINRSSSYLWKDAMYSSINKEPFESVEVSSENRRKDKTLVIGNHNDVNDHISGWENGNSQLNFGVCLNSEEEDTVDSERPKLNENEIYKLKKASDFDCMKHTVADVNEHAHLGFNLNEHIDVAEDFSEISLVDSRKVKGNISHHMLGPRNIAERKHLQTSSTVCMSHAHKLINDDESKKVEMVKIEDMQSEVESDNNNNVVNNLKENLSIKSSSTPTANICRAGYENKSVKSTHKSREDCYRSSAYIPPHKRPTNDNADLRHSSVVTPAYIPPHKRPSNDIADLRHSSFVASAYIPPHKRPTNDTADLKHSSVVTPAYIPPHKRPTNDIAELRHSSFVTSAYIPPHKRPSNDTADLRHSSVFTDDKPGTILQTSRSFKDLYSEERCQDNVLVDSDDSSETCYSVTSQDNDEKSGSLAGEFHPRVIPSCFWEGYCHFENYFPPYVYPFIHYDIYPTWTNPRTCYNMYNMISPPFYESSQVMMASASSASNTNFQEISDVFRNKSPLEMSSPLSGLPSRFHMPQRQNEAMDSDSHYSFSVDWKTNFKEKTYGYDVNFIDSHCHIDLLFLRSGYDGTWTQYQQSNKETFPANYEGCIAVFCNPFSFKEEGLWTSLAEDDNVWLTFGCHPKNATEFSDKAEEGLLRCLKNKKVVALGEIGLDYSGIFKQFASVQKSVFRKQLVIAVEQGLPLVIHCRDAEDDCLHILEEVVPKNYKIHCHCFTGTFQSASKWLNIFPNLYIGLTPLVTYRSATGPHEVARFISLERLLLETDSPYFIPRRIPKEDLPYSHPGMAIVVAEEVAFIKKIPVQQVLYACRQNTYHMYGI